MIRVEADIGGMRAGLAKARAFAEEDPGNPLYDIVSAELYEKAGRRDDAVDLLEKAVAARPSDGALIGALSGLYARTGDPGKAEAILNTRLQSRSNGCCDPFGLSLVLSRAKEIRRCHRRIHARCCRTPGRRSGAEQFGLALSTKGRSGESTRVGRASGCRCSGGG